MRVENKRKIGLKKELIGIVTSDAMDKTITVSVQRLKFHPIYKKGLKRTKKYKVHDEGNKAKVGDVVRIRECRPLSKTKRWRLVEVIQSVDVVKKKGIDSDLVINELEEKTTPEPMTEEHVSQ